jgi:glycosyltransferase involved in cell wall biosynthesis
MRIGIDISTVLNHGKDIGAGRYITNLIRSLFEIDGKNTYVLTGRYITDDNLHIAEDLKSIYENTRSIKPAAEKKIELKLFKTTQKKLDYWNRAGFPPIEMKGFHADILHCPDYIIPPTFNKKIILTIHDLAFMRFPHFNFDWFIKKYQKLVLKNSRIAANILASSESTRNDIIRFFNTDAGKVHTVHLAAEKSFKKLAPDEIDRSLLKRFGINKRFILSVGTIEPRKNYVTLIKAFNQIKETRKDFGHQLVIVGKTGWLSEAAYAEFEQSPYRRHIIFPGRLPDAELVQLYNMAELFIYPSIFEGFGLPVIEAMQCGLAVLASNTSSIPELIHERHLLFNPADEAEIAGKILEYTSDEAKRKEAAAKCSGFASKFSWEKTAAHTLDIYRKVYGLKAKK